MAGPVARAANRGARLFLPGMTPSAAVSGEGYQIALHEEERLDRESGGHFGKIVVQF